MSFAMDSGSRESTIGSLICRRYVTRFHVLLIMILLFLSCSSVLTARLGINHSIEVLALPEDGHLLSARWIPQGRLSSRGRKELEMYFSRQLLCSPIWRYILSIVEVRFIRIHTAVLFIYSSSYSILYSPIYFTYHLHVGSQFLP